MNKDTRLFSIGVLGGTFDPIHYGHLQIAEASKNALKLDELRLIPCQANQLKKHTPLATGLQRLTMLYLAASATPQIKIDEREIKRKHPSYTIDTLNEIRQEFLQKNRGPLSLSLLMASDVFMQFDSWHRWQEIVNLAHVIIILRPGQPYFLNSQLKHLLSEHEIINPDLLHYSQAGHLYILNIERQHEWCSSAIRNAIKYNKDASEQVPLQVWEYINKKNLYR